MRKRYSRLNITGKSKEQVEKKRVEERTKVDEINEQSDSDLLRMPMHTYV